MNVETLGPFAATMGGGFFGGMLIGYAVKKIIKIAAVVVGLFLAASAYLQYQQIVDLNWNKVQTVSQNASILLGYAISHIPSIGATADRDATVVAMSNISIPLTGSTSMGFAVGFMKG
jgi:uncharacterized membrane protein (Fun14 family)